MPPLVLDGRDSTAEAAADRLVLNFEQRSRRRFRALTAGGLDIVARLPAGPPLRDGDVLFGEGTPRIGIAAAAEPLSEARAATPAHLMAAAWHLGNRHAAIQVGPEWLRYYPDHVLDALLENLGLVVARIEAPFDPLPGAHGLHRHHGSHA